MSSYDPRMRQGTGGMHGATPGAHAASSPYANPMPVGPQFVEALPPKRNTAMNVVTIVIMGVALLATFAILLLAVLQAGVVLVVVAIVLAAVTILFVWLVVWFIDRWEPEPKLVLFGAVLWGAGIATGLSLGFGWIASVLVPDAPEWMGAVVQAPIVEEITKGLGVLVIFFAARKHINSPTDGIVVGALSGAGFAFTENILYFSGMAAQGFQSSTTEGVVSLGFQYLIRGVALPLLHPICTSLTGAGIGWGARRGGIGAAIGGGAIGLIPAILVHAIWNGGTTAGSLLAEDVLQVLGNTALLFFFVMVPIFIGWIIMVVVFRRGDRRLIRERLSEYAAVGWYSPAEVDMLSTMQGRSGARSWASRLGPQAKSAMREFIVRSSQLAHTRHQVLLDPASAAKQRAEHELLDDITRIRRVLDQSQRSGMHAMAAPAPMQAPAHMPRQMPQPVFAPQPQPGMPYAQGQAGPPGYPAPQPQQGRPAWNDPQRRQGPVPGAPPQQYGPRPGTTPNDPFGGDRR